MVLARTSMEVRAESSAHTYGGPTRNRTERDSYAIMRQPHPIETREAKAPIGPARKAGAAHTRCLGGSGSRSAKRLIRLVPNGASLPRKSDWEAHGKQGDRKMERQSQRLIL